MSRTQTTFDFAFKWYERNEKGIRSIATNAVVRARGRADETLIDELLSYSIDVIAQCFDAFDPTLGILNHYINRSLRLYFKRYVRKEDRSVALCDTDLFDWYEARSTINEQDASIDLQYAFDRVESSYENASKVVILYELYGCTFAEIAIYLGCSTATARTRYEESLELIRRSICQ